MCVIFCLLIKKLRLLMTTSKHKRPRKEIQREAEDGK